MSNEVSENHVKQYSANVFHLSQQKNSRLRGLVRTESQKSKSSFYDRIGKVAAQKKAGRHSDTPQLDTPHSRRRVTMNDFEWADLVDDQDKIRMIYDPTSFYAQAASFSFGRTIDDEIIVAALGNSYGGEEGNTVIALPNSQKLACFDGATATGVNLNILTLRKLKQYFDANDVDEMIQKNIAVTSSQIFNLLGENQITSSDYNTIQALVHGKVDQFMGFTFVRLEGIPRSAVNITYTVTDGTVGAGGGTITAAKSRRCFAWAKDGLLLSVGKDVTARISERSDKSYSMQVYMCMSLGATRMEEEKLVEVICSE